MTSSAWLSSPLRAGGVLALLTFVAYLPALRAGFVWDDDGITLNPLMQGAEGLWRIWVQPSANEKEVHYWPLVYTTFWVEYQLWGLKPFGYHLVNVALHAANTLLIWSILRRWNERASWWAAALFAVHPIHVESVAWIIERKDVLSGLFYLLAFRCYLRFHRTRGAGAYAAALLLLGAGLLSKSIVVTWPAAMVLWLWWRHGTVNQRDWVALLPFVGLVFAVTALDFRHMEFMGPVDVHVPPLERILVASRAPWFYLGKLLRPVGLMPVYPRWALDPAALWNYVPLVGVAGLGAGLWLARHRTGRGPLVALAFFLVTLGPVLCLVPFSFMRYSFVADRFAYLASIGPIALAAGLGTWLCEKASTRRAALFVPAAGLWVGTLGLLTWWHCGIYRDQETFWTVAVRSNPGTWCAHHNLGVALSKQEGRLAEAAESLERAIALAPGESEIHNTLGITLAKSGRFDEAERCFRTAARLDAEDANSRYNLGYIFIQQERFSAAIEPLMEAVRLRPGWLDARCELGLALLNIGRIDEASVQLRDVLRREPGHLRARRILEAASSARAPATSAPQP